MNVEQKTSTTVYDSSMQVIIYFLLIPCFLLELLLSKARLPRNQNKSGVRQMPSITAKKVALFRHLGTFDRYRKNPNPDSLARSFLGRKEKQQLLILRLLYKILGAKFPNKLHRLILLHIARTHFFDSLITEYQGKQIVILGSGMDSRAYRLAPVADKTVFEVDIDTTLENKKSILAKQKITALAKSIRYCATDFNQCSLIEDLETVGFNRTLPTLFIWEGVTYYLPEADVKNTIAQLFVCKDWFLGFDYTYLQFVNRKGRFDTKLTKDFLERVDKLGEPFVFGIDEFGEELWFNNMGLEIVRHHHFEDWVKPFENASDWSTFTLALARAYVLTSPSPKSEVRPSIGKTSKAVSKILRRPDYDIEFSVRDVDTAKLKGSLLMLPGAGRPAKDLDCLAAKLQQQGFRSIILQYPGIGASTLIKLNTLHDFANYAHSITQKEWPNQDLHLVGHAYGNRIARAFGRNYPQKTKTITLLAAGGHLAIPLNVKLLLLSCYLSFLPTFLHNYVVQFLMFSPSYTPPRSWLTDWHFNTFMSQLAAINATPLEEWKDGGSAPMLIVQGNQDRIAPPKVSASLQRENKSRVKIESINAGHALLPESLDEISLFIEGFITPNR